MAIPVDLRQVCPLEARSGCGCSARRRRPVHNPRSYGRARHHRSDARLCGLRRHRLEADRRLRSPRLADIANVLPFPVCIVSAGRHSRESDQRRSRPARGIHPRACREPASPLRFSPGFSSRQCRDPIRGLTELPSRGRVPAPTGRRSIERTSLPSAVSFDRPRPDA